MTNVAWLWPVRFGATSYVLRVTAGITTTDLSFPASGSLDPTLDYWLSGDGQTGTESDGTGRADLVAMLQIALRAHANMGACVVTLDPTTGLITVSNVAAAATLRWSHANTTLDATVFGWLNDADSTTSSTVTAPNVCQGAWRPGSPVAIDSLDRQPTIGGITRTLTGARRVSRLALAKKQRDFAFVLLDGDRAIAELADATDPSGAFESAWLGALSLGWSWRHYDNAALIATPAYRLYAVRELVDPIARNGKYFVLWDVTVKATLELEVG